MLASASPRRRDLLLRAGVAFEIRPADLDETPAPGETAVLTLTRLAREKARAVATRLGAPRRVVLGADTGVLLGDVLYGKPSDPDDAIRMISELVGHTHEVITAVAVTESVGDRVWECAVKTRVTMRAADRDEIAAYVATGEPMDKAGAYAYQGEGRRLLAKVEGSETNVIGLPMDEALALIARANEAAAS